jgi:hypothetical protein
MVAMHGGALQGFYSRVLLVPESKAGRGHSHQCRERRALNALQYRLLDQYMTGSAPTDWIKLIADNEDQKHAEELARLKKTSGKAGGAPRSRRWPLATTKASTATRGTAP